MKVLDIIKKSFGRNIKDIKIVNDRRIYIEILPEYIKQATEFLFKKMKLRFVTATGIDEVNWMEIVYHFSFDKDGVFINIRVKLDRENPSVDTISDIIVGAKWIEREIYELLGINFNGNDDLRSLLLSEEYKKEKYPLRK